jgi:hypothetical protein
MFEHIQDFYFNLAHAAKEAGQPTRPLLRVATMYFIKDSANDFCPRYLVWC